MSEFENNAYFWQKIDTLFLSSGYTLTKKKGETHDVFKNLVYPTDYGKVQANGEQGISVYAGSGDRNKVTALIIAADILAKELDVKVLAGCNAEEEDVVLHFLNQTDYQKTVLIRRGSELPGWAMSDN
jgi:inorganic pyrophosphatase